MEKGSMYTWLKDLVQDENFKNVTSLTDKALLEKYDMELLLRFVVFRKADVSKLGGLGDLSDFLTDRMLDIARDKNFDFETEEKAFKSTFKLLNESIGSNSFRRYDVSREKFLGGFLVSAFELVALGIGYNYDPMTNLNFNIDNKIKEIWGMPEFINSSGSGSNVGSRLPKIVPLGREIFKFKGV
jgi:hypothetical protein